MNITLAPKRIFKLCLLVILILLVANVAGIIAKDHTHHPALLSLTWWFNFDAEKNIPSFFSTALLLGSSLLLFLIANFEKQLKNPYILWTALACIFLFLSMDEFLSIHERLISPVRNSLNTTGFLHYAWVIPYGIAVIIFITIYLKFLFKLPKQTMVMFLISGAIFLTGAIGFEMLGARHDTLYGINNTTYQLLYTCEELLEMLGISTFIYTLLTYIMHTFDTIHIAIQNRM